MVTLINTGVFPGDDMSPEALTAAAASMRYVGASVSDQAAEVAVEWRKLRGAYEAPEAETLFDAIEPAAGAGTRVARHLGQASDALVAFAEQVRDIKRTLEGIRAEANAFLLGVVDGEVRPMKVARTGESAPGGRVAWHADPATVARNNDLIEQVSRQAVLLQSAERTCANAINAVVDGPVIGPRTQANPNGYGVPQIPYGTQTPWGQQGPATEDCARRTMRYLADDVSMSLYGTLQLTGWSVPALDPEVNHGQTDLPPNDYSPDTRRDALNGLLNSSLGFLAFGVSGHGPLGHLLKHIPGPVGDRFAEGQEAMLAGQKDFVFYDKWSEDGWASAGATAVNVGILAALPFRSLLRGISHRDRSSADQQSGSSDTTTSPAEAEAALAEQHRDHAGLPPNEPDGDEPNTGRDVVDLDPSDDPSPSAREPRDETSDGRGSSTETPGAEPTRPVRAYDENARPSGNPTRILGSAETKRSLNRENETAVTLAQHGYDVEQNPPAKKNGKAPDYRIQGEYWDCYSPGEGNLKSVLTNIRDKVGNSNRDGQAERIVLNLDNAKNVDEKMITEGLDGGRAGRVKEVIFVKNGKITAWTKGR